MIRDRDEAEAVLAESQSIVEQLATLIGELRAHTTRLTDMVRGDKEDKEGELDEHGG